MRPVARLGDLGVPHCTPFVIDSGSPTVFVNLLPAAALGDVSSPHLLPEDDYCPGHVSIISTGSGTVFVDGRPLASVGDYFADCTFVATGSPTVFVGL